jgi:hypothetical protein
MHLKTSSGLAVLASAAVLAGCGSSGSSSSSGVSAATYVKSVCSAVAPFERDVVARSGALNPATIKNPTQGKQALQSFLSAVATDAGQALSQLKNAGEPNVKNGKQIAGTIVTAFSKLKTAMSQAASQAGSLPTNDVQAFKSATQGLGTTLQSSMTSIGTSLQSSTLKSPELKSAAAKEPTCKSLSA